MQANVYVNEIAPPTGITHSLTARLDVDATHFHLIIARASLLQVFEIHDGSLLFLCQKRFASRIVALHLLTIDDSASDHFIVGFDTHTAVRCGLSPLSQLSIFSEYSFVLPSEELLIKRQPLFAVYGSEYLICVCGSDLTYLSFVYLKDSLSTVKQIFLPYNNGKIIDICCVSADGCSYLGVLVQTTPITAHRYALKPTPSYLAIYSVATTCKSDTQQGSAASNLVISITEITDMAFKYLPYDTYALYPLNASIYIYAKPLAGFLIATPKQFFLKTISHASSKRIALRFTHLPEESAPDYGYIRSVLASSFQQMSEQNEELRNEVTRIVTNANLSSVIEPSVLNSMYVNNLTSEQYRVETVFQTKLPLAPTLSPAHPAPGVGEMYPMYGYVDSAVTCKFSQIAYTLGGFPALDYGLECDIENKILEHDTVLQSIYNPVNTINSEPSMNLDFLGPRVDVNNFITIPLLFGCRITPISPAMFHAFLKANDCPAGDNAFSSSRNEADDAAVEQSLNESSYFFLVASKEGLAYCLSFSFDGTAIDSQTLQMIPVVIADRYAAVTTGSPGTIIPPTTFALLPFYRTTSSGHGSLLTFSLFVGSLEKDSIVYGVDYSSDMPAPRYYLDFRSYRSSENSSRLGGAPDFILSLLDGSGSAQGSTTVEQKAPNNAPESLSDADDQSSHLKMLACDVTMPTELLRSLFSTDYNTEEGRAARLPKPFQGSQLSRTIFNVPSKSYGEIRHIILRPLFSLPSLAMVNDGDSRAISSSDIEKPPLRRPTLYTLHRDGAMSVLNGNVIVEDGHVSLLATAIESRFPHATGTRAKDRGNSKDTTYNVYNMLPGANLPEAALIRQTIVTRSSERDGFDVTLLGIRSFETIILAGRLTDNKRVQGSVFNLVNDEAMKASLKSGIYATSDPTLLAFTFPSGLSLQVLPMAIRELDVQQKQTKVSHLSQMNMADCGSLIHAVTDYREVVALCSGRKLSVNLYDRVDLNSRPEDFVRRQIIIPCPDAVADFYSVCYISGENQDIFDISRLTPESSLITQLVLKGENSFDHSDAIQLIEAVRRAVVTDSDMPPTQKDSYYTIKGFLMASLTNDNVICFCLLQHSGGALAVIPIWVWVTYDMKAYIHWNAANEHAGSQQRGGSLETEGSLSHQRLQNNTVAVNLIPQVLLHALTKYKHGTPAHPDPSDVFNICTQVSDKKASQAFPFAHAYEQALKNAGHPLENYWKSANSFLLDPIAHRRVSSVFATSVHSLSSDVVCASNTYLFMALCGGETACFRLRRCARTVESMAPCFVREISYPSAPPVMTPHDLWASPCVVDDTVYYIKLAGPFRAIYLVNRDPGMQTPSFATTSLPKNMYTAMIHVSVCEYRRTLVPVSTLCVPTMFGSYSFYNVGNVISSIMVGNKGRIVPDMFPPRQLIPLVYLNTEAAPRLLSISEMPYPAEPVSYNSQAEPLLQLRRGGSLYLFNRPLSLGTLNIVSASDMGLLSDYRKAPPADPEDTQVCAQQGTYSFLSLPLEEHRVLDHRVHNRNMHSFYNTLYLSSFAHNTKVPVRKLVSLPPSLKASKLIFNEENNIFSAVLFTQRYEIRPIRSLTVDEVLGIHIDNIVTKWQDRLNANATEFTAETKAEMHREITSLTPQNPDPVDSFLQIRSERLYLFGAYNIRKEIRRENQDGHRFRFLDGDFSYLQYRILDTYPIELHRSECINVLVSQAVSSEYPDYFGRLWQYTGGQYKDEFGRFDRRNRINSEAKEDLSLQLESKTKELVMLGTGYILGPDEKTYGRCCLFAIEVVRPPKGQQIPTAPKPFFWGKGRTVAFRMITQEEFQNAITALQSLYSSRVILISEGSKISGYHLINSKRLLCCSKLENSGYVTNIASYGELYSVSDALYDDKLCIFRAKGNRQTVLSRGSNCSHSLCSNFLINGAQNELSICAISTDRVLEILTYVYQSRKKSIVSRLRSVGSCRLSDTVTRMLMYPTFIPLPSRSGTEAVSNVGNMLVCGEGSLYAVIPVSQTFYQILSELSVKKADISMGPHLTVSRLRAYDADLLYTASQLCQIKDICDLLVGNDGIIDRDRLLWQLNYESIVI